MLRNTDVTTNLNTGSQVAVPIGGEQVALDSDYFALAGTTAVQILFTGRLMIAAQVHFVSSGGALNRRNIILRCWRFDGGVFRIGSVGAQGYIRNASNNNEGTASIAAFIVPIVSGEFIFLTSQQEADAGDLFMTLDNGFGSSHLMIQRV